MPLLTPKLCSHCGKIFTPKRRSVRFCTSACWRQSRRERILILCDVCHTLFEAIPSNKNPRFCSIACRTIGLRTGKTGANAVCLHCGVVFFANSDNPDQKFCSRTCYHEYGRKRVTLTCETCRKTFEATPSEIRKNIRFCSRTCWKTASWQGETSLERIVRKALETMRIPYIAEYRIHRYSIDFYLPSYQVAVEADGEHWHKTKRESDCLRDAHLLRLDIRTIRLSEHAIHNNETIRILQEKLKVLPVRGAYWQQRLFD